MRCDHVMTRAAFVHQEPLALWQAIVDVEMRAPCVAMTWVVEARNLVVAERLHSREPRVHAFDNGVVRSHRTMTIPVRA